MVSTILIKELPDTIIDEFSTSITLKFFYFAVKLCLNKIQKSKESTCKIRLVLEWLNQVKREWSSTKMT